MPVLDASSIIYAWDTYPHGQFPPLWRWLRKQAKSERLKISHVALREVGQKAPDCHAWLKETGINVLKVNNAIASNAFEIKRLLKIRNDQYHPKGVGENDILIIATAQFHGLELITDEAEQKIPPDIMAKRKIPSVCALPEVNVQCIRFTKFLMRSGEVFGE